MAVQERVANGRYRLTGLLGSGGAATVHRAHDEVLGRDVAVKVLRLGGAGAADPRRMQAEGRVLARLNHPGLVSVYDAGVEDGFPYLVLQLVEGTDLAARLEAIERATLTCEGVAALGAELADALAHVHERGLVHRDVKPTNVLLGTDNRALLADFGAVRVLEEDPYTATGLTIGTAAYLAPEQVRGETVTPATDVYALGLVLLECLTGEREYPGGPTEAARARLQRTPRIPGELPREWKELLRGMTADDPRERPGAAEVAVTLRQLARGTDPEAVTAQLRADDGETTEVLRAGTRATALAAPPDPVPDRGRREEAGAERSRRERRRGGTPRWLYAYLAMVLLGGWFVLSSGVLDEEGRSGGVGSSPAPARVEERLVELQEVASEDEVPPGVEGELEAVERHLAEEDPAGTLEHLAGLEEAARGAQAEGELPRERAEEIVEAGRALQEAVRAEGP